MKNSERWIIVSFILIVSSLLFIAKINAFRAEEALAQFEEEASSAIEEVVEIEIEGAVNKPGTYTVPVGTPMKKVVKKARPKVGTDLQKLPLTAVAPMKITIEELQEITITVTGAIGEPKELVLPIGSRICDLKSKITLTGETDKTFFRRRRLLKNGEIIEVPKKAIADKSRHRI